MKQFMEQMINDAVIEAARIDGAGEFRIFWQLVMPLVKPAWLTLIIFSFKNLWNIGGTVYIQTAQLKHSTTQCLRFWQAVLQEQA